ncbi:MAG: hypothetical protein M3Q44_05170 [bacterium]|nr:hypothetical protein [bacterium]
MNKKYFSLSLILFVVVLAGCASKNSETTPAPSSGQIEQPSQKEVITGQQRIAQAMTNGTGVTCTIQKKDGTDSITFEMKGKKSKASGASLSGGKGTGFMINDGEHAYIWNDVDKKGVKMSLKGISDTSPDSYQDFTNETTQKDYEAQGYTYNCTEASLADAVFIAPKDVIFQDLSALMDSSRQLQGDTPTGNPPTAAERQKLIDSMKQYQDQ